MARYLYLLVIAAPIWAVLAGCGEDVATAPAEADLSPPLAEGEKIVKANCFVCHAQGINGAPIIGNDKMWAPRAPQGIEILVEHAMSGYGLMPAKGGNDELGEREIRLAIGYMLSELNE